MGLLDLFRPQAETPFVQSILPNAAVQEIMRGRLPILNTNRIFLKSGEACHYIDKAIYEKETVQKRSIRRSAGYSVPGLFKGTRIHFGGGTIDQEPNITYQKLRGILYITNHRIIFQGAQEGFDMWVADLVAIAPYSNCVELQTRKAHYRLFVPDGNLLQTVLQLIQ